MKAVGVDIGGTKIEAVLADNKGNITKRFRTVTQANKTRSAILSSILYAVDSVYDESCSGIGIGIPGVAYGSRIVFIPNVNKIKGVDLKQVLRKFKAKIMVDNDANCFTLAEHSFGAGRKCRNMAGVIIGTGIGGGIVMDNSICKGQAGFAGEWGHMIIENKKRFMDLCSGPSIERRYLELTGEKLGVKSIFERKDNLSVKFQNETVKLIAMGLSNIANTIDPELMVLGGGVSNLRFYGDLNRQIKKYCTNQTKVVKHKLGDSSGSLGAALLILDSLAR